MQHEVKLTHLDPLWLINWLKNFCFIILLSACVLAQLCLTLWDPIAYNLLLSSVHGIFQAKVLEWFAIPFSRGSFQPRDQTHVSCIGRLILYHCVTWEVPFTFPEACSIIVHLAFISFPLSDDIFQLLDFSIFPLSSNWSINSFVF